MNKNEMIKAAMQAVIADMGKAAKGAKSKKFAPKKPAMKPIEANEPKARAEESEPGEDTALSAEQLEQILAGAK